VRLLLASASPRRAELLRAAGIAFDIAPSGADETMQAGEPPDDYVLRVARSKAEAVVRIAGGNPVLGADTAVLVDDQVLGKPTDEADARGMLDRLSGRRHVVLTGVSLLWARAGTLHSQSCIAKTVVEFAPLSAAEIEWYVASGEALDKAGAYAIQGLASRFVTRIEGSYSNVVGLPVAEVYRMCRDAGILIS